MLDEAFRWSLIDAWALAGKDFKGRCWVRWRLLGLGCAPHIGGGSLGAEFAVGLRGLKKRSRFDPRIALTAGLADPNQNRGKPEWSSRGVAGGNGQLHGVQGIANKLKAALKANIELVVLAPEDEKQWRNSELKVTPASTVDEAFKILVRGSLWRKLRGNRLAAVLAIAISVLIGVIVVATTVAYLSSSIRDRSIRLEVHRLLKDAAEALPLGRTAEAWARIGEAKGRLRGAGESLRNEFIIPLADQEMLAQIETVQVTGGETENVHRASLLPKDDGQSLITADHLYQEAFRDYGIDIDAGDRDQVAARVQASAIWRELVASLDHWSHTTNNTARRDRLILIADRVDDRPESITRRIRRAFATSNKSELLKLASEPRAADQAPSTLFLLATALRQAGAVEDALRLLSSAHEIQPRGFWVNLELGKTVLYWKRSDPADALRFFEAALAGSGRNPGVYVYIGNAHVLRNDLEAAEASFRRAISLQNDFFVAHIDLGCVLTARGMLDEAERTLKTATEHEAGSELAHFNLGFVHQLQGKLEAAAESYRSAIKIRSNYVEAFNNLGNTLTSLGRLEDALSAFDQALALRPDYAKAHYNRGFALDMQGKTDAAVNSYRTAIKCDPTFALSYYNLAHDLYFEEGKFHEAKAELDRSLNLVSSIEFDKNRWLNLIAECQRLERLDDRLNAFLARGELPPTAADACEMAYIASWPHRKLYRLASNLYEHAFNIKPSLAENLTLGYRYHAAGCAARAGCGLGGDVGSAAVAAGLRDQARKWLLADLAERGKQISSKLPALAQEARQKLGLWQKDPNLKRLQDPTFLGTLPEPERESWRDLWSQVAKLSK